MPTTRPAHKWLKGWLRSFAGDRFKVYSAGMVATVVRAQAIEVMNEIRIDVSGQKSKTLEEYLGQPSTTSSRFTTPSTKPARPFLGRNVVCTGPLSTPWRLSVAKRNALGCFGR